MQKSMVLVGGILILFAIILAILHLTHISLVNDNMQEIYKSTPTIINNAYAQHDSRKGETPDVNLQQVMINWSSNTNQYDLSELYLSNEGQQILLLVEQSGIKQSATYSK